MSDIPLGREVQYKDQYSPEILFAIDRQISRDTLGFDNKTLPFQGTDIWNAYELSWLDSKGKPQAARAEFWFPCDSPFIVESKSFKLYLNSLNQTRISSSLELQHILTKDLSACVNASVRVILHGLTDITGYISKLGGICLDDLDISVDQYEPNPQLLLCDDDIATEQLHSHLLRSLCPVTAQPDWGSVVVEYSGPKINRAGLLSYLIGFRQHQEFHEQCVERIFIDISRRCKPNSLLVRALYTRRGGLDINPCRSSGQSQIENIRLVRQ
jgi:7-cyano-7-deazaguanine reductase